jgi:hypothetical protein
VTCNDSPPVATGVTQARLTGLRSWNLGLTVLHVVQAVVVVLLAGDSPSPSPRRSPRDRREPLSPPLRH